MAANDRIIQQIACKAVICRQGKVLVLREADWHATNTKAGLYQIPGGRIEPGESFAEALVREVKEETDLAVTAQEPFFVGEWSPLIHDQRHQIIGIFFTCVASTDTVALSDEHDELLWIDPKTDDLSVIMQPDRDAVIRYAEKYLN